MSIAERGRSAAFTLVELVVYIALVAIAVAGVLLAYNAAARDSADPVVKKQAIAIAESLLEEIQQMPFTFCDPDDPAAPTAASTAACSVVEALGPEPGESRYSATTPFDNVNDYNGYSTAAEVPRGIKDISGTPVAGLSGYDVSVTVAPAALPGVAASESLLITVTVTAPKNVSVRLDAYRTRYAPQL